MAMNADDLDGFLPLLATIDTKSKLTIANNLINYLSEPENSIECSDIGQFIDSLIPWMNSSNNKVSQSGIDAMAYVVDRMGHDFRPYVATVLPPIVDRLGDSKEVVREKAQLLLLRLAERDVLSPQTLLEKLTPAFAHKNGKIREEALQCLQATLTEYGAASLSVSRLVPHVVKLLSDPQAPVRDKAFATLVEVYRHVGERLRQDLQKKHPVPASKLPALMARFDELRLAGDLLPSALAIDSARGGLGDDEPDRVSVAGSGSGAPKRASSVPRRAAGTPLGCAPPPARAAPQPSVPPSGASAASAASGTKVRRAASLRRTPSTSSTGGGGGPAGAMDEETFSRAFEDTPSVNVFSVRDLEEQLSQCRDVIGDNSKDWNKRVDAMKKLRGLVTAALSGGSNLEEAFVAQLRSFEPSLQASARDLRSQVVREACLTISFMAERLRNRADRFTEILLPSLIQLIQNSAKIMASAGAVSCRLILRYVHAPRLIPIICREMAHKSRDIRRACCEFLDLILGAWGMTQLERHAAALQEALRRGIADADPEARLLARKAYWSYRSHFPDQAEQLLNSLDASYRRALNGELSLSNSSSSNSLHHHSTSRFPSAGGALPRSRMPGSAQDGSTPLRRAGTGTGVGMRSSSAIDLQAAQRAKARAQYAALARHKVGSGASLRDDHTVAARPRKSSDAGIGSGGAGAVASPERVGRTRSRVAGVSQSQPTSRSGSPSSRLSYATYASRLDHSHGHHGHGAGGVDSTGRPRRLTGIPRSTGASREASRETSPSRFGPTSFGSKLRGGRLPNVERTTSARPVMAQKILQQSREAESALADALNFDTMDSVDYSGAGGRGPLRKRLFDDHSDDSETSSVCSERSFDSFRRPSDSFSWSGSQQRLYRESLDISFRDISEVIANCASTHWGDRKEGLVGLQAYLQSGQLLSASELRRVTETFTKMFMDSHTKVFSLFLDTLLELLQAHRADLNDWLYILLTRLLNKLGTDLLGSIHTKIQRLLTIVRESFPADLQMACLMRFLTDATQTPNARVRVATLAYLSQLCASCGDPSALSTRDPSPGALARIIALTADAKSGEVRRAAQAALLALFNLATPQVTMLLGDLPPDYQETAAPLLQSHLRRSSAGGGIGSPPSPTANQIGSPGTPQAPRQLDVDTDDLNPEEVYRSLRRTTAEIQSYSFGDLSSAPPVPGGTSVAGLVGSKGLGDRDRDTTSQDSGISQMSAGAGDRVDALEEHFQELSLTRNNSGRSSSLSSPTHRLNSLHDYNGLDGGGDSLTHAGENGFGSGSRDTSSRDPAEDSEALRQALETIRLPDTPTGTDPTLHSGTERKKAFFLLQKLAKEAAPSVIEEHFKVLLRVVLELLGRTDEPRRDWALGVLAELLERRFLAASFQKYVELIVLKVLESYRDPLKEVWRVAELCSCGIGAVMPADAVIRVLNPMITTGDFPVNMGAIKMLMKVVENHTREELEPHLSEVMPALMKAYNNEESSVRKSAVFCMVALHNTLGEGALQPHLNQLSGSKLKLLQLYIKRAQTKGSDGGRGSGSGGGSGNTSGPSAPTSPKNSSSAAP